MKELHAELAIHLPPYMNPGLVVALPELPMHPNGKVNFNALKENAKVDERLFLAKKRGGNDNLARKTAVEGGAPEGGYDSLAITVDKASSKKPPYEHLGGMRAIATLFIIYYHYVFCGDVEQGGNLFQLWMTRAAQRSGSAAMLMSLFAILAGFSCHMQYLSRSIVSEGCRAVLHFFLVRLDRLLFTLSFTMILCTCMLAWGDNESILFSRARILHSHKTAHSMLADPIRDDPNSFWSYLPVLSTCLASGAAYSPFWGTGNGCPNSPGWFVGALWPAFCLYPLLAKMTSFVSRKGASTGLLVLWVGIWLIGLFGPGVAMSKVGGSKAQGFIEMFPTFTWANFAIGIITAEIAHRHDLWSEMNMWDEAKYSATGGSFWPSMDFVSAVCNAPRSVFTIRRLRGILADLVAILYLICFVFSPVGWCTPDNTQKPHGDASCNHEYYNLQHVWAIAHCLFIYGSCANGKAGVAAKLLRHPILISAGTYAFGAYLFQQPVSFMTNAVMMRCNPAVSASTTVFLTWLFAVQFTHLVETPCVLAFRSSIASCINKGCPCCPGACACCGICGDDEDAVGQDEASSKAEKNV